jgi:CRISPR-associated protein Cas1
MHRGALSITDGSGILGNRQTRTFDAPKLPASFLIIGAVGMLSCEALAFIIRNGRAVFALTQGGVPIYAVTPAEGLHKPGLLRLQVEMTRGELGLELMKHLLIQKLEGQEKTLHLLTKECHFLIMEEHPLASHKETITNAESLASLRLAEAQAALAYFSCWKGLPVAFRKPRPGCMAVPTHWQTFESRRSLKSAGNRDATDPINAALNLCYTVAATQVHAAILGTGLNPSLGILHEDKDGRPSFVYDLLEPLRPIVDRIVLSLVLNRVLTMNEDFFLLKDGTCRVGITLAQELARTTAEMLRGPSLRIVEMVRKILLAASERTYRVPRAPEFSPHQEEASLPLKAKPAPQGKCCTCGKDLPTKARFCDACRRKRLSEVCKKTWEARRIHGDPAHSPEANALRSASRKQTWRLRGR